MTGVMKERIAFDVETERILKILSEEIYDSPKAFLRENVQNAYDAILMRCTAQSLPREERRIDITVGKGTLTVQDDGIGMSENVLKNNFWKAGSSGKRSELAQKSGVIGTFGIGAMANFGVCTALRVETRNIDSKTTLISTAKRAELRIAQDCIDLEHIVDERTPGTIVHAELDADHPIDEGATKDYLAQYVRFLPVPVYVNGALISQHSFSDVLGAQAEGFEEIGIRRISRGDLTGRLRTSINRQGRVLARLDDIGLGGNSLGGELFLVQQGGQTLGFRNLFGLAPIPVSSTYGFGGFVNLSVLHPTAGREALSRESIQLVANLVSMIEAEASNDLAERPEADGNQLFQQYVLAHGLTPLAKNLLIPVRPSERDVRLAEIAAYEPEKQKHYYSGRDPTIIKRFATEQANLFHVSQDNPRRKLQLRYLSQVVKLPEVPERTIVERLAATELTFEEAMLLVRVRTVLLESYFLPDIDVALATISHGVAFHVEKRAGVSGEVVQISISRDMPALRMVIEAYKSARDLFASFAIDFVREHLYPHIRDHVPSSTRLGRDALYRRLKENEELFRLELGDYGDVEGLLADFLSGKTDLDQVLRSAGGGGGGQRQEVSRDQVGTVEQEIPDIIGQSGDTPPLNQYEPAPPILRPNAVSTMKVLTVAQAHAKLNGFQMFLAVSDRLVRSDGDFLHQPHMTRLMWASHRVIYIFTVASEDLSLYYDIKLKEPLDVKTTGGGTFPTTTIITKDRIYIPIPKDLESAFSITDSAKEFFVRFDTIT